MTLTLRAAVLTGDLIGSAKADPAAVKTAFDALTAASAQIAAWIGADTRLTRFRGDGWQIVMSESPELALRAAVFLIASLRAVKGGVVTRVAIGIGPTDSLGTQNLSDAAGPAFTLSGRALDRGRFQALAIDFDGITPLHLGYMDLIEAVIRRWTPEQAQAITFSIPPDHPLTQEAIGQVLGISPQAVSYRLTGASDFALRQALRHWESAMEFWPDKAALFRKDRQ